MNILTINNVAILAQKIIDGSIEMIEGCRQLVHLNLEEKIRNAPDFLIIRGFESETDDYPIGDLRKLYHQESLKKLDQEVNEYIKRSKPTVIEACRNLIKKYSQ